MELAGKYLVIWLSAEGVETFLGILDPQQDSPLAAWVVAGQVVGESTPGLWVMVERVTMPDGRDVPVPDDAVYFLRWELLTTARLYEEAPREIRRIA
jgi:hypothetical protein